MKIRNGFVSNSSSSSFLVVFDDPYINRQELKRLLFGNVKIFKNPYYSDKSDKSTPSWSTDLISQILYRDMKEPCNSAIVVEEFMQGAEELKGCPRYPRNNKKDTEEIRNKKADQWEVEICDFYKKEALKFVRKNKGKYIFRFEYSDEHGELFSALEHGNLFRRLPHVKVNKH